MSSLLIQLIKNAYILINGILAWLILLSKINSYFPLHKLRVLIPTLQQLMKTTKIKSKSEDGDYDINADPKRKNYKKIRMQIKQSLINDFYNDGIGISILTKKYHLSYSTIAHILKVFKERRRIFQPKSIQQKKGAQSILQKSQQIKSENNEDRAQNIEVQPQIFTYYPFFPLWNYFTD